jgi:hypothetical protein
MGSTRWIGVIDEANDAIDKSVGGLPDLVKS